MSKNKKYFLKLTPLCSVPHYALLLSVVGAYNKGYTVRGSARVFPKFAFLCWVVNQAKVR